MKKILLLVLGAMLCVELMAQEPLKKVYDETIDPLAQIDAAVKKAQTTGRYVVCQVGGNWCPWCLRFADFITQDSIISETISHNFVYIHVNYSRRGAQHANTEEMLKRLGNPGRFGYPVFVVLDEKGNVLHTQDSSFLEEGKGYSQEKVLRFFRGWTPAAVRGEKEK